MIKDGMEELGWRFEYESSGHTRAYSLSILGYEFISYVYSSRYIEVYLHYFDVSYNPSFLMNIGKILIYTTYDEEEMNDVTKFINEIVGWRIQNNKRGVFQ